MSEEDKKMLIEMKDKCLNASVYDDENRLLKANAITNALKEIERLKNDIKRITEITNQKIKIINDVREYIKENEKEYGSLEDNEKIILEIIDRVGDKE